MVSFLLKTDNRRLRRQRFFKVLLLCFSTAAILLISEAVLRFVFPLGYFLFPPHLNLVFTPYQNVMPGISGESKFKTNSQGIRGDELTSAHTYRILAIGGSTTQCDFLDQSEAWPFLLQKRLNNNAGHPHVWVGNAGKSGMNTRNPIMAMKYLPIKEMKIDAVILLIGINDLHKRLSRDSQYDPNFLAKPNAEDLLINGTFIRRKEKDKPFFKKTALWQLLTRGKRTLFEKPVKEKVIDKAGEIYITWREHRQKAAEIRTELPDLSAALAEYASNINKIIDMADKKSLRLIFMTQPTLWRSDLPKNLVALLWLGGIGDFQKESGKPYYSVEALQEGMEKYNDVLRQICHQRDLECIDLSSMLEKDTSVFYDDVHFNENGARKVSNVLSKYLMSHEPFKRPDVEKVNYGFL